MTRYSGGKVRTVMLLPVLITHNETIAKIHFKIDLNSMIYQTYQNTLSLLIKESRIKKI